MKMTGMLVSSGVTIVLFVSGVATRRGRGLRQNHHLTGFEPGGTKGLWFSNTFETDNRLVITETAIDALSFYCLNPDPNIRYYSVGGEMNPAQPGLITGAVSKMPEHSARPSRQKKYPRRLRID